MVNMLPTDTSIRRDITIYPASAVVGTVVSTEGQPIPDARVSIAPTWTTHYEKWGSATEDLFEHLARRWSLTTVTDSEGKFEIAALNPDEWTILAEAEDFESNNIDITLKESTGLSPVAIVLEEARCLQVLAVDHHGNPIENAQVAVSPAYEFTSEPDKYVRLDTDPEGVAEICDVPVDHCLVSVSAEGMAGSQRRNRDNESLMRFELAPAGTLIGSISPARATTGTDSPLVLIRNQEDSSSHGVFHIIADEEGYFEFGPVAEGPTSVRILCDGETAWTATINVEAGRSTDLGVIPVP